LTRRRSETGKAGPASAQSPKRLWSADELIADLFEAMHDLRFLQNVHEGAEFVLALVLERS